MSSGPVSNQVSSGASLVSAILSMRQALHLPPGELQGTFAKGVTDFCDEMISADEAETFFRITLPGIALLALRLPDLLASQSKDTAKAADVPVSLLDPHSRLTLLRQQQPGVVMMTQELAASLLAVSFLCLFPTAAREKMREINFDQIFGGIKPGSPQQPQKLRCLLHYFHRVVTSMPRATSHSSGRCCLPHKLVQKWTSSSRHRIIFCCSRGTSQNHY